VSDSQTLKESTPTLAEPANIDTSTPDPAIATGGIDRQKALLNDLIANGGQAQRQLYERQSPEAQQLLQNRLADAGAMPDARKAVYDAFSRDQTAAEAQHTRSMNSQAVLNSQLMDAAKAAVPIHSKNVDAQIEAMRLAFEDKQRERQAAAAARAAASAKADVNPLIEAQKRQDEYVAWAIANGKNPDKFTAGLDEIDAFGMSKGRVPFEQLADKFNIDLNRWKQDTDPTDVAAAQSGIETWLKSHKQASFSDLGAELNDQAAYFGLTPFDIQMLTLSNAPRWGIDPGEIFNNEKVIPTYRRQDAQIGLGYGDVGPQAGMSAGGAPAASPTPTADKQNGGFMAGAWKTLTSRI